MKHLLFILFLLPVVLKGQIITNFAGGGTTLGDGGAATSAKVTRPGSSGFDSVGNFYFLQALGSERIRMIDTSGIIHTVAGNGTQGYSGDGGLATNAQLGQTNGIAIDLAGNIYIADFGNYRVRKVDAVTHIITTICGTGVMSSTGDDSTAIAATIVPYGLCADKFGNVFVLDGNNATIRKIDTSGIITRFAGNGVFGCTGDNGPALNASLSPGNSICFSPAGDLFFSSCGNRIRKINMATGIISAFAGNPVVGPYNGDEISADTAQFDPNWALAFDSYGNLFMSSYGEHKIRKIDSAHIIHTVAGTGVSGYSGDGGPAIAAQLYDPEGVAIDRCNNLYISDEANNRIRKVTFYPGCSLTDTATALPNIIKPVIKISPNPAENEITISGLSNTNTISIINTLGQVVLSENSAGPKTTMNISVLSEGLYFIVIKGRQGKPRRMKFVKE